MGKKYVTLDPRRGTLALDMEPSTLDKKIDSAPSWERIFGYLSTNPSDKSLYDNKVD